MANSVQSLNAPARDVAQDQSHRAPSGDDHGVFDGVLDQVRGAKEASANSSAPQDNATATPAGAANPRLRATLHGNAPSTQSPQEVKETKDSQLALLMTEGDWLQPVSNAVAKEHPIVQTPENPGADNQKVPGQAPSQEIVDPFMPGIAGSVQSAGGNQIILSASGGPLAQLEQAIGGAGRHVAAHLALPDSPTEQYVADVNIPAIRVMKAETHFRPVVEGFTVQLDKAGGAQASTVAVADLDSISKMPGSQPQTTLLKPGNGRAGGIHDPGPDVRFTADDSASEMLESLDRSMLAPEDAQTSPIMKAIAGFIETEIGPEVKPFKTGFAEVLSPTYTISAKASQEAVRQLSIQLRPAELGVVNVSLRLEGDVLELRMEVDNEQAAKLLMRDRDGLCASLRASGYRPEVVTIVVTGAQQASETPHQQQQSQSHQRGSDQSGEQSSGNGSGGNGAGNDHDRKNGSSNAGAKNSDENASRGSDRLFTDAPNL